jgi:hypothetical protein
MDGILGKLREKGPGGLPLGVWAGVIAVGLYLGYRWFSRGSGSNAGAGPTTQAPGPGSTVQPAPTIVNVYYPKPPKKLPKKNKNKNKKGGDKNKKGGGRASTPTDRRQGLDHTDTRAVSTPDEFASTTTKRISSQTKANVISANILHRKMFAGMPTASLGAGEYDGPQAKNKDRNFVPRAPMEDTGYPTIQAKRPPQLHNGRKDRAGGRR